MHEIQTMYQSGKTERFNDEQRFANNLANILEKNDNWLVYDSCLQEPLWKVVLKALLVDDDDMFAKEDYSFQNSFKQVLPRHRLRRDLKYFIEHSLQQKRGEAIGIELGGPGSVMFQGFSRGFFKQTLGVTLLDRRTPKQRIKDERLHHDVVELNLLDPNTIFDVKQTLNGRKADLIIERMFNGLSDLPRNPYLLTQRFNEWYQLLNEGGIFLAQIPPVLEPVMNIWTEKVTETSKGSFDIHLGRYGKSNYTVMRLIKHAGAPENIPVLSPRELRSAYIAAQK